MCSQTVAWMCPDVNAQNSEIIQQQHAVTTVSHGVTVQGLACCALPCGVFFNVGKSSFKINTNALIINRSQGCSCHVTFDIIRQYCSHYIRPFVCLFVCICCRRVFMHGWFMFCPCLDHLILTCSSHNNPAPSPRWHPARAHVVPSDTRHPNRLRWTRTHT